MKKLIALSMIAVLTAGIAMPVFADDEIKNIKTGGRNVAAGWVEAMDSTHEEASKGKSMAGHLTGTAMGGVVGVRKTLYRAGAGAIVVRKHHKISVRLLGGLGDISVF